MGELRAENVVTGYGKLEILHGVSLEATSGRITSVFGPNGSGKSTLVKTISGTVSAWSGTITLDGKNVTRTPDYQMVGQGVCLMPQGGGIFPRLTVEENLRVGGHTLSSSQELHRRVERLLDEYPALHRRRSIAAGSLSGGEQMMLAIARALVTEPSFLLFDEPSAGLSPKLVQEAMDRIEGLKERGVGVLMVEQNIREAMRITDYLYILVAGQNRFQGTPGEIGGDRHLMDLYLGAAS